MIKQLNILIHTKNSFKLWPKKISEDQMIIGFNKNKVVYSYNNSIQVINQKVIALIVIISALSVYLKSHIIKELFKRHYLYLTNFFAI